MDWEKFKEFISDKRNRAIVKLGAYVIFFIFVAVFFRAYSIETGSNETTQEEKTPIGNYCTMRNYEFNYSFVSDTSNVTLTGKLFRSDVYITLDGVDYYIKDSKIYQVSNDTFVETILPDLPSFTTTQICNFVNVGKVVAKTEDYENNVITTRYSVPLQNIDESITSTDVIYVTVYETNEEITKTELDLTSYLNLVNEQSTSSILTMEYFNRNGVTNFTTMFSEDKIIRGVE